MIKTTGLAATHMECRNLKDSMAVMTDLLAFEKISEKPGEATLKHPNTHWLLVLHEVPDAPTKQMHNHWGVRVVNPEEVDRAYEYLVAHKAEYKLGAIGKPTWSHGSYSCYFVEPGTNGWEIECYEAFNRKQATAERFGAVKMAHWDETLAGRSLSRARLRAAGIYPRNSGRHRSGSQQAFLHRSFGFGRASLQRPCDLREASPDKNICCLRAAQKFWRVLDQLSQYFDGGVERRGEKRLRGIQRSGQAVGCRRIVSTATRRVFRVVLFSGSRDELLGDCVGALSPQLSLRGDWVAMSS